MGSPPLRVLVDEARACRICADALPHEPRPVFSIHEDARVLLIGQAPGAKVHASGVPWADASGRRLRSWLALDEPTFYDPTMSRGTLGAKAVELLLRRNEKLARAGLAIWAPALVQ